MNEIFRWLHISDLHFGQDSYSVSELRRTLPIYLSKLSSQFGKINYIFITGDLRFAKNAPKDYLPETIDFINNIITCLGICKKDVCIIPGNHDITGTEAVESIINDVYKNYVSYDGIIDKSVFELLKSSIIDFENIYQKITTLEYPDIRENPHFIRDFPMFQILHINTSYLTHKKQSGKNILVGLAKLSEVMQSVNENKPLFAMGHHPLSFLDDTELKQIENLFKSHNVKYYFCGHQHINEINKSATADNKKTFTEFITSSNSEDMKKTPYEMGFQIGTYDTIRDKATIQAYEWKPRRSMWFPDVSINYSEMIYDVPGYEVWDRPEITRVRDIFVPKIDEIINNGIYDEYIKRNYVITPDSNTDTFNVKSTWDFMICNLYGMTADYRFYVNVPENNCFKIEKFKINGDDHKDSILPNLKKDPDEKHKRVLISSSCDIPLNYDHKAPVQFVFTYAEKMPVIYLNSSYMYPAKTRSIDITIVGEEVGKWIINAGTFSSFRNLGLNRPPYTIENDFAGFSEDHQETYYTLNAYDWTLPGFGYSFVITKREHSMYCWRSKRRKP